MAEPSLNRRDVVAELLRDRGDLLVVSGLGSPSYDVMAAGDHPRNYYLWAAMGSAATIGLGLAMACPDQRVLVVTGDGEMLMGMGALATIAVQAPRNLTLAILDNGHYGETGMQRSHAGLGVRLEAVAAGVGIPAAQQITDMADVTALRDRIHRGETTSFAAIQIDSAEEPRVLPPRDGVHIKNRVRAALGHPTI